MNKKEDLGKAFDARLFKRILVCTQPYRVLFWGVALAAVLSATFAIFTPVLVKNIISETLPHKNHEQLLFSVGALLGVLLGQVISQLGFTYYANLLGESVIKDMRVRLFQQMLGFKMAYFDNSSVGVLVTRAVVDMQRIGEIFSQGFFVIIADILKMVSGAALMVLLNWKLALLVFTLLPIILVFTRWFQRAMKQVFIDVRTQVAHLNAFVQERIAGIKIIQLFNREELEKEKFRQINKNHQKAWLKTIWYNSIFFPFAELAYSIGVGLVVYFGVLQSIDHVTLEDTGSVFAFFFLINLLFRPLRQIAENFNTLQMGMVAAYRVFRILDTKSYVADMGTLEAKTLQGTIEFRKVRFGYVTNEEVLRGISFKIPAGEMVAIVGATGAGKSTLINLLTRFYEINSGEILIDGRPIQEYTLKSLRSHIALVLQEVFLFADTIANNITLYNTHIPLSQIKAAAQQIGVHEFIASLPGEYQYNVKERGAMLSRGQRQLIAFLRAYVSNPSILILDEATASIDTYSEQLLQRATEKVTAGRTSIIIAHRLATIKKADRIIVMKGGQIIETGTHRELLKKEGYYRDLYRAQFAEEKVV